jgi:putative DNA methylase
LQREDDRRADNRRLIDRIIEKDPTLAADPVLMRWVEESKPLPQPWPTEEEALPVRRVMGDPAWGKERIAWETAHHIRTSDEKYGYERAFNRSPEIQPTGRVVLDPTAGGGSIPLEALRLGHTVVANELNPVATVILHATLDYPARFGPDLSKDISYWGKRLRHDMVTALHDLFPASQLDEAQQADLRRHLNRCPEFCSNYLDEYLDGFIFARQVTCPHCGGEAPLLNTCWLAKEAGDPWGVRVVPDGQPRNGKVSFQAYRVVKGRGPHGEDPNLATVDLGVGRCVHCQQAISADEIKAQARGESPHGRWIDRLYCIVAVRLEPELDRHGQPLRYTSGLMAGEIKTRKVRFFRPPNDRDLEALDAAARRLQEKWPQWETAGLIPTERFPEGNDMRPVHYGMPRWCDLFTPRQLLGHLTLIDGLNRLKPKILTELGADRGRAVITYLQFAIDKGLDYNSRQTRWHYSRGAVIGTFGRHDFSLKWTFGEMIFTGPNSGVAWALSQIVSVYKQISTYVQEVTPRIRSGELPLPTILNGTAAHMPSLADASVDLACMDPPDYDNVQYGELSDYFYIWQKRTLGDLYPELFTRRLVDKSVEAVANPARNGSTRAAKLAYEQMMGQIFAECQRVLKSDGLMTLMFTHKTQEAWESLTRSLIEAGWTITASFPVESEAAESTHQKNMAAAASSIFLSCRKMVLDRTAPAPWTGLAGQGVQQQIRHAVKEALVEFAPLRLTPVDEMVAAYGRALRVLSQQWPVMDGDEAVGPIRAMNEASRVVAEHQIARITRGRLAVDDLDPETAMALTLYGIWGLNAFAYDEALNLSRSLNIALSARPAGYRVEGRMIGINQEATGQRSRARGAAAEDDGFHAPLVRKGSKLRLALPEERHPRRLTHPQTDWDILHGLIAAFRRGDIPVARAYLDEHAPQHQSRILDLLDVWAAEMDHPDLKREAETLRFGLRPMAACGLRSIPWKLSYRTSTLRLDGQPVDILHDFYIPALQRSVHYDRMAGYFRSTSLAAAAQGFSAFVGRQGRMRLIVGADLDPDDVRAILQGDEERLTALLNAELEQTTTWPRGCAAVSSSWGG